MAEGYGIGWLPEDTPLVSPVSNPAPEPLSNNQDKFCRHDYDRPP